MLLTLTTTRAPATDLGWLLHKHPDRVRAVDLSHGRAHVFWPEASEARATMAFLVELDPIGLVRGKPGDEGEGLLAAYVNDRPYVTSSFFSVALSRVFRSALAGDCARPELVDERLPLELRLEVVAARGGEDLLHRLFEPLGYTLEVERLPRDEVVDLGPSALYRLGLRTTAPVGEVLRHLYVLLPVLDDDKHYFVGRDEVDKLLDAGEGWLADHPERELVTARYLKHQRALSREALERLVDAPELDVPEEDDAEAPSKAERALEKPLGLNERRMNRVVELLAEAQPRRVLDLGCGEGKLLRRLLKVHGVAEIVGVDASSRSLDLAEKRLDRASPTWRSKVKLLQGSVTWRDPRLDGFDVAAVVEVIEHLEPGRLAAFAAALLGGARPRLVVLTTPNAEHNVRFGLPPGAFRHADHRFEWTRAELRAWIAAEAERWGYEATFEELGEVDPEVGAPTQLVVLRCR